ncbi:MAG: hypothetical protein ACK5YO_35085 [Planctomyces sp.]|jgi:hypothetical protein
MPFPNKILQKSGDIGRVIAGNTAVYLTELAPEILCGREQIQEGSAVAAAQGTESGKPH